MTGLYLKPRRGDYVFLFESWIALILSGFGGVAFLAPAGRHVCSACGSSLYTTRGFPLNVRIKYAIILRSEDNGALEHLKPILRIENE